MVCCFGEPPSEERRRWKDGDGQGVLAVRLADGGRGDGAGQEDGVTR
ncbi:MAG: hypothetical protein WC445_03460 [Patescibacteria group bacterium]